jgi:hypothetical protein
MPGLRFVFFITVLAHYAEKICQALLALTLVCVLIAADTSKVAVTPERLLGAVHIFLDLFGSGLGLRMVIYKIPLDVTPCRSSCLERKHRLGKRYAEAVQKINKNSAKKVLKEILCHRLGYCRQPNAFFFDVGLIGGRPAQKSARAHH